MKSIITDSKRCYICKKLGFESDGTEEHHMIHGTANRSLADADGLTCQLCHYHHVRLHDHNEWDRELQKEAQGKWMEHYGKSVEDWIARYGESFL